MHRRGPITVDARHADLFDRHCPTPWVRRYWLLIHRWAMCPCDRTELPALAVVWTAGFYRNQSDEDWIFGLYACAETDGIRHPTGPALPRTLPQVHRVLPNPTSQGASKTMSNSGQLTTFSLARAAVQAR